MDMNKLIIKSINKKKLFCCNCGKYGHKYNKCVEPITSLGVIALKVSDMESYNKLFVVLFILILNPALVS